MSPQPKNLGELRRSQWSEDRVVDRTVRQELRENLLQKMEKGEPLFARVHGYDDTVVPQSSTRFFPGTTLFCWGCAVRPNRGFFGVFVSFMDPQVPVVEGW